MRIDSHHHLWDLDIAPRGWLAGDVLAPLNRTFSMDDFYAERASAKIDKSILVQTLSDYEEMKEFFNEISKFKLENIISIDETSIRTSLSINYCREELGKRFIIKNR